jgi:hypothetical protein
MRACRNGWVIGLPLLLAARAAWSQSDEFPSGGDGGAGVIGGVLGGVFMLVYFAIIIVAIASMWKIFVKAGKPGWAAIVPIYNMIVLLEIAERPLWWFVLLFVPLVNIVVACIIWNDVAKRFGQGPGFTVGLVLLPIVFMPLLAFGDYRYQPLGMNV